MRIIANGRNYQIWLRGQYSQIRSARKFEQVLHQAFTDRYGEAAVKGKTIFQMDEVIGMISKRQQLPEQSK